MVYLDRFQHDSHTVNHSIVPIRDSLETALRLFLTNVTFRILSQCSHVMGNVETLLQENGLGSNAICRRHTAAGRGSVLVWANRWRRVSNAREQTPTVSNARWPTAVAPATIDSRSTIVTRRWCISPMPSAVAGCRPTADLPVPLGVF